MSLNFFRCLGLPRHTLSYALGVTAAAACLWILALAALFTSRDGHTTPRGTVSTSGVEAARSEYDEARRGLRRARAEAAAANADLDEFLSRHFDEHRAAVAELQAAETGSAAAETANAQPGLPANFRREVLLRRLEELMIQRDRLREVFTPLHPALQEIELQVSAINQRLAGMPESAPATTAATPTVDSESLTSQQQAVADFDATREAAQQAEERVARATAAEQRAVERYAAASTRLSNSLRLAASSEHGTSQPWALVVLGASLVTVSVAGASLVQERRRTFSSLSSIKAVLGIPLVGVLSGMRGTRVHRGPPGGAAISTLVMASELTVALAIVCVLGILIFDPILIKLLFIDPVGAITEGAQHLSPGGP